MNVNNNTMGFFFIILLLLLLLMMGFFFLLLAFSSCNIIHTHTHISGWSPIINQQIFKKVKVEVYVIGIFFYLTYGILYKITVLGLHNCSVYLYGTSFFNSRSSSSRSSLSFFEFSYYHNILRSWATLSSFIISILQQKTKQKNK